jgi:hypothetical protein
MKLHRNSMELHMPIFYGEISMEFFCRAYVSKDYDKEPQISILNKDVYRISYQDFYRTYAHGN